MADPRGIEPATGVRLPAPELRELLEQTGLPDAAAMASVLGAPTPERRIFVNRNLRMDQVQVVGFDMDYTLALYNQPELERLSIELTVEKLVEKRGYSPEIRTLPYDRRYALRGLVVDRKLGNLLKVDRYGHVGRAYHGTKKIEKDERYELYRMATKTRLRPPRFAWIDTLFALPEASMYVALIDFFEARGQELDYDALWQDVRDCIDEAHRDDTLKTIIKADMARYIGEDPEIAATLHKLRSSGKRLFLATNSLYDYTDAVMRFLLDGKLPAYPSWRNYFDYILVGTAKPAFFTEPRPFQELDAGGQVVATEAMHLHRGRIYQGGNLTALQATFADVPADQVLYVGDHIYGDMVRSKKSSNWRTVMIVQELEEEIAIRERQVERIAELEGVTRRLGELDADIHFAQTVQKTLERLRDHGLADRERVDLARRAARADLERLREQLKDALAMHQKLRREIDSTFHPFWGQLFREGNENSRFGEQVEDYADMYTSRVSNLLRYSPLQYFRAPRDYMPHEL